MRVSFRFFHLLRIEFEQVGDTFRIGHGHSLFPAFRFCLIIFLAPKDYNLAK